MSLDDARNPAFLWQRLHVNPNETSRFVAAFNAPLTSRAEEVVDVDRCRICDGGLSDSQVRRGARFCSSTCRAKGHDRRDPRISNASIEQLEGELVRRLEKQQRPAGVTESAKTVRALTRNVRVLKATWVKLRSMTPKASTYMLTLERLVHDAWIRKEEE